MGLSDRLQNPYGVLSIFPDLWAYRTVYKPLRAEAMVLVENELASYHVVAMLSKATEAVAEAVRRGEAPLGQLACTMGAEAIVLVDSRVTSGDSGTFGASCAAARPGSGSDRIGFSNGGRGFQRRHCKGFPAAILPPPAAMDACPPVHSISEDFASSIRSAYLCCKLTYLGTKQCTTCISAQENGKVVPMEDLKSYHGCSSKENLKVEEIGTAFSDLHVEDSCDHWSHRQPSLDLEMCDLRQKDEKQTIPQKDPLDVNTKKGLGKSATFPCPGKVLPSPVCLDAGETISSASLQAQCSLKSDKHVYTRSNSLPATTKLVSALKGGREKEGAPPKTNLAVKWAPDVYDPPATSVSHTVNSHHYHRPKARKKDQYKHKHKSKSSRGGGTREKKQHSRLQVPGSSSSAVSSVRVLNYTASNQESKCGSSVALVESLAKLHFSVAEAT